MSVARWLRRIRNQANKRLVQVQNRYLRNRHVLGRPFQLTLESGNVCNLKCPLCATTFREDRIPRGILRLEEARRIIDSFPYTVFLILSNWGEPFLNKDVFEIISHAKSRDIDVRLESNLTLFDDEKAALLVASGLDTLVVALDGATQESYERYRVGGKLADVIENVERIRAAQEAAGDFRTKLRWKMVVNRHNEHEVERCRAWAAELGMEFDVVTIWVPADQPDWLPSRDSEQGERTETGAPSRCHNLWQSVTVNFNGDVFPCCSEFSPADKLVNVLEEPFEPVWNGADYRARRALNRGPVDCSICHRDKDTRWHAMWLPSKD